MKALTVAVMCRHPYFVYGRSGPGPHIHMQSLITSRLSVRVWCVPRIIVLHVATHSGSPPQR